MPAIPNQSQQQNSLVVTLQRESERFKGMLPAFLAKSADRLFELGLRNAQRPELARCRPESIAVALIDSAKYGIPCDGVHAAIVPFKGQAQFMPMYRGLIMAARRTQKVKQVWASAVYACDAFEYEEGAQPKLVHKPDLTGNRGADQIVGFYACARFDDGFVQFAFVTLEEARATQRRSPAGGNGPWVTDFAAMGMKTAVRRLSKFLPLDVDIAELFAKDEAVDLGLEEPREVEIEPTPSDLGALAARELSRTAEPVAAEGDDPWSEEPPAGGGETSWDAVKGLTIHAPKQPLLHGKTWAVVVHDPGLIGTVEAYAKWVDEQMAAGKPVEERHLAVPVARQMMRELYPEPAAS